MKKLIDNALLQFEIGDFNESMKLFENLKKKIEI